MLFHAKAIDHDDSQITYRQLSSNELISNSNIFKIWSILDYVSIGFYTSKGLFLQHSAQHATLPILMPRPNRAQCYSNNFNSESLKHEK